MKTAFELYVLKKHLSNIFDKMFPDRTRRFLEMFFIRFCMYMGIVVLSMFVGALVGYLLIKAVALYGVSVVITTISVVWIVLLVAAIAGKITEEKLAEAEYKEREFAERLRSYDEKL